MFPWWYLRYCQVNTGKRKSKDIFVGFGRCLWLRMCYLSETCGIVKLIPESASRKRFSLALDDPYLWDWIIKKNNELWTCGDILYLFVIHTTRWRQLYRIRSRKQQIISWPVASDCHRSDMSALNESYNNVLVAHWRK